MSCSGACNQGRSCSCAKVCESAATEGGNVWFTDIEPAPVGTWKAVGLYCLLALFSIASIVITAGACGWIYQTFIGG